MPDERQRMGGEWRGSYMRAKLRTPCTPKLRLMHFHQPELQGRAHWVQGQLMVWETGPAVVTRILQAWVHCWSLVYPKAGVQTR